MSEALKTRAIWKFFFAWQVEQEERWLEHMAAQGWHLRQGAIRYTFEQGPPTQVRYALDYRRARPADLHEFQSLCDDAGWEYVCRFGNWHYYRTESASAPDIYTDNHSLIERDRRVLAMLIPVIAFVLLLTVSALSRAHRPVPLFQLVQLMNIAVILLGVYAVFRVWRHLLHLRAKD